jgi:hypothetical protein
LLILTFLDGLMLGMPYTMVLQLVRHILLRSEVIGVVVGIFISVAIS